MSTVSGISGIEALIAGYSPAARVGKPIVVLQAYVDDSRKMLGRKSLFMAGYINFPERWIEFSREWARVLREGRPIQYLHMVDAHAARGEFRGWGRLDREIKVAALAQVVANSAPWSFHVSVNLSDFAETFDKSMPHGFQSPYLVCFIAVATQIGRHTASFGAPMPVDLVFDEQNQIHKAALALYDGMKAMQPDDRRIWMGSTPIFRSDKDVLPLQAADMLAWHVQREIRDGDLIPKSRVSNLLIQDGRHSYIHIDRDGLQRMREQMLTLPGVKPLSKKAVWKAVIGEIESGNYFPERKGDA